MPNRPVITFAASVFEGDDLFVFALFDNLSGDLSFAVRHVLSIDVHQHLERRGFAFIKVEKIDIYRVAFCDAILPTASLDDCVGHNVFSGEKKPRKLTQNVRLGKQKL
jgi:hypothetical protein